MIIEGGTGAGYKAKVTDENMLVVQANTRPQIGQISQENGLAYTAPFIQAGNSGADDMILYMKNLSEKPIILSQMWINTTAAVTIQTKYGATGVATGTSLVPVNMSTLSSRTANVTMLQGAPVGVATGGTVFWRSYFTANAISQRLYFDDAFVLGQNGVFSLHILTAVACTVQGVLMFYFHGEE